MSDAKVHAVAGVAGTGLALGALPAGGPGATFGEFVVGRMRELEFVPTGAIDPFYLEFRKDYADDLGRMARVRVQFAKPGMQLSGIVVSVQKVFAPDLETIAREAPVVTRDDLLAVVQTFAGVVGDAEAGASGSVDVRPCVACGVGSAEFYVVNGDAVCYACVQQHRTDRTDRTERTK